MATCPANSTLEICDLLEESGTGLGIFLDAVRNPIVKFVLAVALIGGIVGIFVAVALLIKSRMKA